MFSFIIEQISGIIILIISRFGYFGVIICMTVESACIPLPSEIIMPFSGFLVFLGQFNIITLTFAGALGNLIGSVAAYTAGYYGGRPFVEKFGKFILVSHRDLDTADRWFTRYGDGAVFFSRMLPIVRTFISLPAGISKMSFTRFSIYTFLGSVPWCFFLAFIGLKLGENWNTIGIYFHQADLFIGCILLIGIAWFIKRHLS